MKTISENEVKRILERCEPSEPATKWLIRTVDDTACLATVKASSQEAAIQRAAAELGKRPDELFAVPSPF